MAMFKRMYGSATPQAAAPQMPFGMSPAAAQQYQPQVTPDGDFPAITMPNAPAHGFAPMRPTPSGYVPGAPIISTRTCTRA